MKRTIDLYRDKPGVWPRMLAGIFGRLSSARLKLYEKGLLKTKSLPAPVVSVGNLVVGGTGKTPAVIMLARQFSDSGLKPAVLLRGYRGGSKAPVNVVSDGAKMLMGPEDAGDEACLLAASLPGAPVLTGRDRWAVGWRALEQFDVDILLLDDGFQHIALDRDVNLLLLDAEKPWGNGFLLPAGALREPPEQASRASAVILTRADSNVDETIKELAQRFPGRPIFTARHKPVRLRSLDGEETKPIDYLKGRTVGAFCGLARPLSFLNTLAGLEAEVKYFIKWPDHYQPLEKDLRLIEAKALENKASDIVTTAKDAVKLSKSTFWSGRDLPYKLWVLDVEMDILDKEELFDLVLEGCGKA